MKKKLVVILVIFAFLSVTAFSTFPFVNAEISNTRPFDIEPLYDVEHDYLTIDREFAPPNSPWEYPLIDDYTGTLYWLNFTNPFNGTFGNIWIGLDPEYDEYIDLGPEGYSPEDIWLFGYPWTPEGIPGYLPEGYRDAITGWDLLEVLDEFDNNIHNTTVEYFGMYNDDPAERPGPYGDGSVQIMIFNIKDEFFYSPDTAPGFTMGYFWSTIAESFNTNAFHMDSYQWWRRQGETPPMVDPYTGWDATHLSVLAWQYEGTFAHEFQHLIHHDRDPNELSWVNEGCSTLAEWLCGYGFSPGHISEYLLWHWDTPLVIWEQFLADYGASFLWAFYMYEHYGGAELLWDLVQDQAVGIKGWENALAANGISRSFDQIFQDWCIANYLDDTTLEDGRYGYYELDLPSENSGGMSIQLSMASWASWYAGSGYFDWYVNKYPHDGEYIMVGRGLPYTASYVELTKKGASMVDFTFDGDDYASAMPPHSGTYEWHSDGTAWSWYRVNRTFSIPSTGATLKFWTLYEIELDWDYGYVEVYDKDFNTWYTLSGLETNTSLTFNYGTYNDNCPDEVEPTTYYDAGKWNAFSGSSGGWYQEEMDLSFFAGRDIELYFTYWTDPAVLEAGWYIDDIEIPEIGFFDDVESGLNGWEVNAGWYITDGIIWNDFEASFINIINLFGKKTGTAGSYVSVTSMDLDDDQEGNEMLFLVSVDHIIESMGVFVVANQPGYEHVFGTSYSFEAHVIGRKWRWDMF